MSSSKSEEPTGVKRSFSTTGDEVSFYSDYVAVLGTGDEIMLSFYETRPGLPNPEGKVDSAESRRRAVITMSPRHAQRLKEVLAEIKEGEGK